MEGNSTDTISFTSNAKKVGFETVISLQSDAAFVAANALAADGTVLGTTDVWDMELGATVSELARGLVRQNAQADHFFFLWTATRWSCRLLHDWLRPLRRLRLHDPPAHVLFGCPAPPDGCQQMESELIFRGLHNIWNIASSLLLANIKNQHIHAITYAVFYFEGCLDLPLSHGVWGDTGVSSI